MLALVVALGAQATANPTDKAAADDVDAPPPTYKAGGVTVDEHLGARIPRDARFRTQDGKSVTLGEVLSGDLPTILTFNYSDCPMLCSLQLNGLTAALPKISEPGPSPDPAKPGEVAFRLGAQFRIVTIDLEPTEPLEKLVKMRDRYINRLPEAQRAAARTGWTFLAAEVPPKTETGGAPTLEDAGAAIRRVAETVGFKYTYIPERAEWAHPATLIFLSSAGAVTRYVYGIEYATAMMRETIFKAGLSEPATAVGFLNRCYHYDPGANSHAHAGVVALRIGAAGFVVLMLSGLGVVHLVRRNRPNAPNAPGVTRS